MIIPKAPTLKKYGLAEEEWIALYKKFDGCCHLCLKPFTNRSYIDHEHIKNWKQLPPEQRKLSVRGLLDYQCNFILLQKSNDNLEKLRNAVKYLEEYENSK